MIMESVYFLAFLQERHRNRMSGVLLLQTAPLFQRSTLFYSFFLRQWSLLTASVAMEKAGNLNLSASSWRRAKFQFTHSNFLLRVQLERRGGQNFSIGHYEGNCRKFDYDNGNVSTTQIVAIFFLRVGLTLEHCHRGNLLKSNNLVGRVVSRKSDHHILTSSQVAIRG